MIDFIQDYTWRAVLSVVFLFILAVIIAIPMIAAAFVASLYNGEVRPVFRWIQVVAIGSVVVFLFGVMISVISLSFDGRGLHRDLWEKITKEATPTRINLEPEVQRFVLVSHQLPTNYYVTLRRISDGWTSSSMHVAKYCTEAEKNVVGSELNIKMDAYRMSNDPPETIRYEWPSLSPYFCK